MKTWFLFLSIFMASVHGQTLTETEIVARLNSDLVALKSLPPSFASLETGVHNRGTLQAMVSPDQFAIMQRYRQAVGAFQRQRHRDAIASSKNLADGGGMLGFANWNQAYLLTSLLAGRDLSDASVTPLTHAILGIVDGAVTCLETSAPLRSSARARTSADATYSALRAVGVSNNDARLLIESLLVSAVHVAEKSSPPMSYR